MKLQSNNPVANPGGGGPRQPAPSQRRHEQQLTPQQQQLQREKPEGYDERRRQRELERRKLESGQQPAADHKHVVPVRSKMYADTIPNSNKKPYDYNNRGRRMSRSPPSDSDLPPKKASRDSSEIRRPSRDASEVKRAPKRWVENKRSLSRDNDSNKRRKRRESPADRYTNTPKRASQKELKELEFRARALQSFISKKEESSKAYNRRSER